MRGCAGDLRAGRKGACAGRRQMSEIEELREVCRRLRAPGGCPWDREQTHETLKAECIEEAAEVISGINVYLETGNSDSRREELGDLLLQVVMQCQIASEEGLFDFEDVARTVKEKMIFRHPHVFGDAVVNSVEEELKEWDKIKKKEKSGKEWMDAKLPEAFEEAKGLIEVAKKRKGFDGTK